MRDKRGRFLKKTIPWNKNKPMSLASREKESLTKKLLFKLGKLKPTRLGVKLSSKIKNKISKSKILFYKMHPENAKKHSDFMKNLSKTTNFNEKHSKRMKIFWRKNPLLKKRYSELGKMRYLNHPELREISSLRAKEIYKEHPHLKEESKIRLFEFVKKHPKAVKNGWGNPSNHDMKTIKGDLVRSNYERIVADTLYSHHVRYNYEEKAIIFDKEIKFSIPDFFLPDYNLLIEVFGLFDDEKSLAKMRWKIKYYKKYKIPFIPLYPEDILNLKTSLLNKLKRRKRNPKLSREARKIMWGTLE